MNFIKNPKVRFYGAIVLLVISILAGIHSVLFIADSSYERILIGISWGAITLTALDIVATTDIKANKGGKK
jgi:hypothetical protein